MNLKKVLLAGVLALAALGSSLSNPAQAQTPTPTPQWKVTIVFAPPPSPGSTSTFAGDPLYYIPSNSPSSYAYATPPAGLNGLGVSGGTTWATSNHDFHNDVYLLTKFTWDGSTTPPSSINVNERFDAYASVSSRRTTPPGGYGNAISYVANLPGISNATTTIGTLNKHCSAEIPDAQTSSTSVPVIYDSASGTYVATLPIRHLESNLVIDWSLEPSIPTSQYPMLYETNWQYGAYLIP